MAEDRTALVFDLDGDRRPHRSMTQTGSSYLTGDHLILPAAMVTI